MEAATQNLVLNNKRVLDIGAGTGNLYDYLQDRHANFEFIATDISAEMMQQSNIPPQNQYVGNCYDLKLPHQQFDCIFMLGVTTYFSEEELNKVLTFIQQHLADQGQVIISFTNKWSVDAISRKLASYPLRAAGVKDRVMTQSFQRYRYTEKRVRELFKAQGLSISKVCYLNHTIFPFNLLFSQLSIQTAHFIKNNLKQNHLLSPLSSDFLIVVND